jgi:thymidylate synthase (FAD)
MKIIDQEVILKRATSDPAELIETMGRICYRSEPKGDPDAFTRKLIGLGHLSVLEHAVCTLVFVTDRGVTHELVRHRIAAYSQESTRYVRYHDIEVIKPIGLQNEEAWTKSMLCAEEQYSILLDSGNSPQIARSVLPTCLATRIGSTMNARQWRHVLTLRLAPKAHPQMRSLMKGAAKILYNWYPAAYEDLPLVQESVANIKN